MTTGVILAGDRAISVGRDLTTATLPSR